MTEAEQTKEAENRCECCRFEYPVGGVEKLSILGTERTLCSLCRNTPAFLLFNYPTYDDRSLKTICYVGNQLRRDLVDGNLLMRGKKQ